MVEGESRQTFVSLAKTRHQDEVRVDALRTEQRVEEVGFIFAIAVLIAEDAGCGVRTKRIYPQRYGYVAQPGYVIVKRGDSLAVKGEVARDLGGFVRDLRG